MTGRPRRAPRWSADTSPWPLPAWTRCSSSTRRSRSGSWPPPLTARNPFFPEVPTVAEAGFPIENPIYDWRGLAVPKGIPPDILKALRDGFRKAAEDPDYIKLMDELTLPRAYMEYDKFGEFLAGLEKSLGPVLDSVGFLKK